MDKQSQPFSFDAIKRAAENLGILAKKTVEKAVPYLDPTNPFYDTIPVLREARMLSNDLLPYDPASDPAIPFKERIPMYLQKYGENFMGSHGGLGKPSVSGKINKASQNQAKGFLPNHVLKDVLRMSDDLNKKGNLSIDDTGLALQYGKQYLGIPEKQFSKQFARMDVKNLLDELMVGMDADQKAAYVDIPNRTKQSNVVNAGLYDAGESMKRFVAEPGNTDITPYTGAEKLVKKIGNIEKLQGENGSFRYVYRDAQGKIIGAAQGVSGKGRNVLSNIYTVPEARNKGIGTQLFEQAKKDFKGLEVADTKTEAGTKFFQSRVAQESIGDSILKVLNKK